MMGPPADRGHTVTVVITNYNYGHLVSQAVRSALAQRHPADAVLVVDDGSTDDSPEVLRELPTDVRVVRREHQGVIATRNAALDLVSTDWLVFLDADDILMPEFLERTLAVVRRQDHPQLGFVYTAARTISNGRRGHFPSRRFNRDLLGRFNYITNTALLRRSAVAAIGYSAEMEAVGHEDWDLYLSLVESGWHGVLVPRPLFVYRTQASGRNVSSLAGWPHVVSTIRRRHPWTAQRLSRWRRASNRLDRLPSGMAQLWWLTTDWLRWADTDVD
jgi:glycosyltransferase involved in cell wall biosynthesis